MGIPDHRIAAADLHAVNQVIQTNLQGKWFSTGISKGGQTTIYYKYFYPGDVDVAIPYVAPIDNSQEDTRIYTFLDTIGTPECRQKIFNFQKFLLMNEEKAVEKLKWYAKRRRSVNLITPEVLVNRSNTLYLNIRFRSGP